MAMGFRPVVRDQEFLLAPNMTDWLPADHVVWWVIDVVAELDLTAFYERAALRRDGAPARNSAGRAGYDPQMLLTLLIYGYACRERSSRQIERLCHTDVAFRVICAGDVPDHSVIARFRQAHAEAFAELFVQVLRLCRAAGLARLGTVAIDGSKIAANASRQANRSAAWVHTEAEKLDRGDATGNPATRDSRGREGADRADREVVDQILTEAAQADAAEDAQYGAARGDELPPGWNDRTGRRERIRAAQARIAAEQATRRAAQQGQDAARAERDAAAVADAEQALAAEVASRSAAAQAWEHAWEHAVAHPGAPLPRGRAPLTGPNSARVRRAQQRVDTARQRRDDPDSAPRPGRRPGRGPDPNTSNTGPRANLTDPDSSIMPTRNGWIQGYNTQFAVSADQIILATHVSTNPADIVSYPHMVTATTECAARLDAADDLGTLLFDAGYASNDTLAADGPDRLIALGKTRSVQAAARDHPATGPPPHQATARQQMDHRLRTPEGAALYKRRGATVEPGIGNFKKILDRFSRRGLAAAISETHLAAAVFNLQKIHRAATT